MISHWASHPLYNFQGDKLGQNGGGSVCAKNADMGGGDPKYPTKYLNTP